MRYSSVRPNWVARARLCCVRSYDMIIVIVVFQQQCAKSHNCMGTSSQGPARLCKHGFPSCGHVLRFIGVITGDVWLGPRGGQRCSRGSMCARGGAPYPTRVAHGGHVGEAYLSTRVGPACQCMRVMSCIWVLVSVPLIGFWGGLLWGSLLVPGVCAFKLCCLVVFQVFFKALSLCNQNRN